MRNQINQLSSLGRTDNPEAPHITTEEEYRAMCEAAGLTATHVGYAPANRWTLSQAYERYHPDVGIMPRSLRRQHKGRRTFRDDAARLIAEFQTTTPIQGVSGKGYQTTLEYQYPIFVSQKK